MNITQFTMEEVRCFAERQQFEIRPLTFLVGENSTGKTTALACFDILANYLCSGEIDFNSRPYSMGTFKNIVRNSKKTEKTFTLGFTFKDKDIDGEWIVEFVEKKGGIEPATKSVTVKFPDGEIVLSADDAGERGIRLASCDKERNQYRMDVNPAILDDRSPFFLLERFVYGGEGRSEDEKALANYLKKRKRLIYSWRRIREGLVFSSSPIRSQPKRTYDPTRIFNDPEGSDVPMLLMETKATHKKRWEAMKQQLVGFGKSSGLFQDIEVKNLGGSMGNPFQLKIKVRGPNSSIIDVGYGVSQILPILVYIFDMPISRRRIYRREDIPFFLLQQPEVHLHPRAQAELSSLLASTVTSRDGQSFIVETHSDYMIDRARIEIRKRTIRPEDVSLIYLEPKRNIVKVHNISFDEMGNMIGVPNHYREFFMKETDRLMGFED